MTDIERIKKEIREAQSPYFDEDDFQYYLDKNHGNVDATCLLYTSLSERCMILFRNLAMI